MKRNILPWAERKQESCDHNSFPLKPSVVAARGGCCRPCVFVQSRTSFVVLLFPRFNSDCIDIVRNTFNTSNIHLLLADFGSKVQKLLKLLRSLLKFRSRQRPPGLQEKHLLALDCSPFPVSLFPLLTVTEVRCLSGEITISISISMSISMHISLDNLAHSRTSCCSPNPSVQLNPLLPMRH